jgi:hypothetical protein
VVGHCGRRNFYHRRDVYLLIFAALALTSGGTWLLIYLVTAIIMPERPEAHGADAGIEPTPAAATMAEKA